MPKYRKNYYSGICLCGHSWERHHLCLVMRLEYVNETGEGTIPDECLAYGHNEYGGLGKDQERTHCGCYIDKDDPDPEKIKSWYGTTIEYENAHPYAPTYEDDVEGNEGNE